MFKLVLVYSVTFFVISVGALPHHRIVNGTDTDENEITYIASLRLQRSGSHRCGVSIINESWALTAAHCVFEVPAQDLNIQYGVIEISGNNSNIVNISEIIVHEDYEPWAPYLNDIALLRLSSALPLGGSVSVIGLPNFNQHIPANSSAVLAGWGLNETNGAIPSHLQKVDLIIFSDEECNQRHETLTRVSNICAGVPEGGKGQCSGDSGGPLAVDGIQVGIVSWSRKPCAVYPYPGVFTKVAYYINWIAENTGLNLNLE